MTYNQKYIYRRLLDGGFITITPTGKRSYTLYDKELHPLKRLNSKSFEGLKKVYAHASLLKKVNKRYYISRKSVRSLRKSAWLKQQLTGE